MSRYETLQVNLQTDDHYYNQSRLSQTIDHINNLENQLKDKGESDQRVKKFRELYFKNEKLRRELKILNSRLNEKLERVKLPSVRRAASVDLSRDPPASKALQRELENAHKQVVMFKQQVDILKVKQQTPQNYAKLRNMENLIAYRELEIQKVKEELKSIKNVKKIQQRKIISDLQNQEIQQRLQLYQKQHDELRDKLKKMARKGRARDQQYKKQQAYLVSLNKKYRVITNVQSEPTVQASVEKVQKPGHYVTQKQFEEVKNQIAAQKKINDQVLKRFEVLKKQIRAYKDQASLDLQKIKEKEQTIQNLKTKILSMQRLIGQQLKKAPKNPVMTNIQDIPIKKEEKVDEHENQDDEDDLEDDEDGDDDQDDEEYDDVEEGKQSGSAVQKSKVPSGSKDLSLKRMLREMEADVRQWRDSQIIVQK